MGRNGDILYEAVYKMMFASIDRHCIISQDLKKSIFEHSSVCDFNKGDILLAEGKECNVLYYVVSGFCSCFFYKDGKESVLQFFGEGCFFSSWHSFLGKRKSFVNIKATEKLMVICIKREQFDWLWVNNIEFMQLVSRIVEKHVVEVEERYYRMRSLLARERVSHCVETHEIHYLMKHVPHYSIASYLNMTQETFSKIFSEKNKGYG